VVLQGRRVVVPLVPFTRCMSITPVLSFSFAILPFKALPLTVSLPFDEDKDSVTLKQTTSEEEEEDCGFFSASSSRTCRQNIRRTIIHSLTPPSFRVVICCSVSHSLSGPFEHSLLTPHIFIPTFTTYASLTQVGTQKVLSEVAHNVERTLNGGCGVVIGYE
jgi:hypothetical protein